MAVKIRLTRKGKKKQPTYRVVVADSRAPRDGRYIEQIGRYDPRQEPSVVEIDNDRAGYWLGVGAQPSDAVRRLLEISGVLEATRVRSAKVHVVDEAAQQEAAEEVEAVEEVAVDAPVEDEVVEDAPAEEGEVTEAPAEEAPAEEAGTDDAAEASEDETAEASADDAAEASDDTDADETKDEA